MENGHGTFDIDGVAQWQRLEKKTKKYLVKLVGYNYYT